MPRDIRSFMVSYEEATDEKTLPTAHGIVSCAHGKVDRIGTVLSLSYLLLLSQLPGQSGSRSAFACHLARCSESIAEISMLVRMIGPAYSFASTQ